MALKSLREVRVFGFILLRAALAPLETESIVRSHPTTHLQMSSQRDSTPSPRIALLAFYFHRLVTKGALHLVPGENSRFWAQGCGSVVDHLPSWHKNQEHEREMKKGKKEGGGEEEGRRTSFSTYSFLE